MGIVFVNTKGRGAIEKRQNIHLYNNLFWVETSQQATDDLAQANVGEETMARGT